MDNKHKTLVSVIIPVFNRTDFLHEAVNSALSQTYEHIEVVVVNDGSDTTLAIKKELRKCDSEKISYIEKKHSGLSATLNAGIRQAKGEFLVFLDDDDLLRPEMVRKAMTTQAMTQGDMICAGFEYFMYKNEAMTLKGKFLETFNCITLRNQDILRVLIKENLFPVNTVLVRKRIVEAVGLFDESMITCMDWDLWLRIISEGYKVGFVCEPLSLIRLHGNNMSKNAAEMQKGRLKTITKASNYLSSEVKTMLNIDKLISTREIYLGWYNILEGYNKEGRTKLLETANKDAIFSLFSLSLFVLSYLPRVVLRRLTDLVGMLINKENIYDLKNKKTKKEIRL